MDRLNYWHPVKVEFAAVTEVPAVTFNAPPPDRVFTVTSDGEQSSVPPDIGTNAVAPIE